MLNILSRNIYLILLAFAMVVSSCGSSDAPDSPAADEPQNISFGIAPTTGSLNWTPILASREGGMLEYTTPESIGVWGYNNAQGLSYSGAGEVFNNVEIFYKYGSKIEGSGVDPVWIDDNDWPYLKPMPWMVSTPDKPVNYRFFAYAPYLQSGTGITAEALSYSGFRLVRWQNVPQFSNVDYMAASNIVEYTAKEYGAGKNEVQHFVLTHFQTRLRLCFRLGDKYSDLRIIHLKEVYTENVQGKPYSITLQFNKNSQNEYVPSYTWQSNDAASEAPSTVLLNNENGQEYLVLSKEHPEFQAAASVYVNPNKAIQSLRIRVVYDVFDVTRQLLRENEEAENLITLNLLASGSTGQRVMRPGYYYDVNIKVEPTFLYVLSDNDVNTDGYLVISE